jgi:hypothetical protein
MLGRLLTRRYKGPLLVRERKILLESISIFCCYSCVLEFSAFCNFTYYIYLVGMLANRLGVQVTVLYYLLYLSQVIKEILTKRISFKKLTTT